MNALVVYDSAYGNTEQIAGAIAGGMGGPEEVKALRVGQARPADVRPGDLLVLGSPTQGGRATQAMQAFVAGLPALAGVRVATFDTRFAGRWVRIFGFAAPRLARALEGKGAGLVAPPEGFIVKGKEGPLAAGELERAAAWGKRLRSLSDTAKKAA